MAQSPYLVQALRSLQQAPQASYAPVNPMAMAQMAKQAQAYQQANPGGNYLAHNLMQAGRNIAAVPGDTLSGLASLARFLPGGPPNPATAGPQPSPATPLNPGPTAQPPQPLQNPAIQRPGAAPAPYPNAPLAPMGNPYSAYQ